MQTEEPPREPSQIAADALDIIEMLEGEAEADVPWQLSRLARQLAELAQHVDQFMSPEVKAFSDGLSLTIPEGTYLGPTERYAVVGGTSGSSPRWAGVTRPSGQRAEWEEIEEGLSRAVVGGIVEAWTRGSICAYIVRTADEREHPYSAVEASAFVDAVFAAERVRVHLYERIHSLEADRTRLLAIEHWITTGMEDGRELTPEPISNLEVMAVEEACGELKARLCSLNRIAGEAS